jgi:hypothetical protein
VKIYKGERLRPAWHPRARTATRTLEGRESTTRAAVCLFAALLVGIGAVEVVHPFLPASGAGLQIRLLQDIQDSRAAIGIGAQFDAGRAALGTEGLTFIVGEYAASTMDIRAND